MGDQEAADHVDHGEGDGDAGEDVDELGNVGLTGEDQRAEDDQGRDEVEIEGDGTEGDDADKEHGIRGGPESRVHSAEGLADQAGPVAAHDIKQSGNRGV